MKKTFELVAHVYEDNSNRSPLMVVPAEGSKERYIRSLENYIKEAGIFEQIGVRTEQRISRYSDTPYIHYLKTTIGYARQEIPKLKVTITVEEV